MNVSTVVKSRGGPGEALIFSSRLQPLRDYLSMDFHYQTKSDFGVSYPQALRASGQKSRKTRLPAGLNVPVCCYLGAIL